MTTYGDTSLDYFPLILHPKEIEKYGIDAETFLAAAMLFLFAVV